MNTTTFAPPASRNAPCPCGSGRRYKDCHGQVGAAPRAVSADLARRMQQALAAQQSGRLDEAIALYGEAIGEAPQTFDAWHMRGVARFQRLEFDDAERDIRRALELVPGAAAARANLALVVQGRRLAEQEEALCREVLPRYRHLCVDPPLAPLEGAGPGSRVFVLDACAAGDPLAGALEADARRRGADVLRMRVESGRALAGDEAALLASTGEDDFVACAGCARPLGDWTLEAQPGVTALVVDGAGTARFIDRLREISGQGRRRVRLAASPAAPWLPASLPHAASGAW